MTVTLAFYKGTRAENPQARLFDRLICWWPRSRGRFSHVELVATVLTANSGRGWCLSSSQRDGGVRGAWIDLANGHWVLVTLPDVDVRPAQDWFAAHMGQGYDWLGVLGFVLPWIGNQPNRWWCSEAVALAIGAPVTAPSGFFGWAQEQAGAQVFELPQGVQP